jgi:hypothetical protein
VAGDDVDALYGLPLDEFTAARNELAKRLRKDGDRERADEVKALAKPSVAAWAVNQLARRRGAPLKKLLDAGDALRKAQEQALGGGGGDALRKASERERDVVTALRREARNVLEESGRTANDQLLERIASTLANAAVDPDVRPLLEAGRLTEEVESSGFDAFAGMSVPSAPPRRAAAEKAEKQKPAKRDAAEARRRLAEERRRTAELRARARELGRAADTAERAARRLAGEAERAAKAAEEAAQKAAEAQEEATAARAAADEARAEARAAADG